jgi:putative 4-mercaptohistidine N1-methyltranferase
MQQTFYETESALSQYLLLHYGEEADILPYDFGPKEALGFPVRCAGLCASLSTSGKALDLGCAVGRSSFELSRYFQCVVAVDYSSSFIKVAQRIQRDQAYRYTIQQEGVRGEERTARLPSGVNPRRVQFVCADVMEWSLSNPGEFDLILAANLLCRLKEPRDFLMRLRQLLRPGGQLILTTPYSWLEEYTPKSLWLQSKEGKSSLGSIGEVLGADFQLLSSLELPFLIREHARKFQWGVAQASVWRKAFS